MWRALIEIGFIIFLFYSNLLMGEFERSDERGRTLFLAMLDVFTGKNLAIAIVSGCIGYLVVEYLRKKI